LVGSTVAVVSDQKNRPGFGMKILLHGYTAIIKGAAIPSSFDCQLLCSTFFFHRSTEIGKHMVDVAPILYSRHHKVKKSAEFLKKLHRLTWQ